MMRKRIVIAACAVVAIGALVFVLSQPKKGTLDWYKREFRRAQPGMYPGEYGVSLSERVQRLYYRVVKPAPPPGGWGSRREEQERRYESSVSALRTLKYFTDERFAVSNRSPERVCRLLRQRFGDADFMWGIFDGVHVMVSAPKKDMAAIEKCIREYDVPETGR